MASADVATRPQQERPTKRRPFAAWVRRLTNLKGGEQNGGSGKKSGNTLTAKQKKNGGTFKNNPYPESGYVRRPSRRSSADGQSSYATPTVNHDNGSIVSMPAHNSNRSAAPTVATNPETVHSDAGYSKAFTNTTGGGALSSVDGGGAGSTFSSPNQSEHSLTTTLTTIHSTSAGNMLHAQSASGQPSVMFSHQYPVSPAPSTLNTASAIPRHLTTENASAGANNVLTDDASIMTLASSSKRRRRRSMDTDASVRALAPNSVFGSSRESLPLSVLSGHGADTAASTTGIYYSSQSRPSIGGIASAERASLYSSSGVAAPALASERNSYYSHAPNRKDLSDAKSLRSITGLDARSQYDAKSLNNDGKSMDVNSLRNYEGSVRSGAIGHGRNDSIPGSIGGPLSPGLRHVSTSGALSRRSSEWQEVRENSDENEEEEEDTVAGEKADGEVRKL